MSIFRNLFFIGALAGIGAYYYDMNSAPRILKDARLTVIEAETRCRYNHESMCKYNAEVEYRYKGETLHYKYRIPGEYYHSKTYQKDMIIQVRIKDKKIFPPRIIGLTPQAQKKIDEMLAAEKV